MRWQLSMKTRALFSIYCLLAVSVLARNGSVQAMKSRSSGGGQHPPTTTQSPTTTAAVQTTLTTIQVTTGPIASGTTQEPATQSVLPSDSNQPPAATTTMNAPEDPTLSSIMTMMPPHTIQQQESGTVPPLLPSGAMDSEPVTLVMAVVGAVVGTMLLIVMIVCIIVLCTAASSYQKIKTGSGQNNIERSGEYGNKKREDVDNGGVSKAGHTYHGVSPRHTQLAAAVRHSYEVVDSETEDSSSSTGEVSLAVTTTSCDSHISQTTVQKTRCAQHEYEIVPSFNNPRSRPSHYDHLSEKESPNPWRYSLNDERPSRLSFNLNNIESDYDTLESNGAALVEKRKSEYSSLDDSVHGYAVLRPHSSCSPLSASAGTSLTNTTQDGQYSHLIHH